jgi:hypothetical protein
MLARRDEALEMRLGMGDRVGPRDADDVEALFARLRAQRRLDALAQKSRSA